MSLRIRQRVRNAYRAAVGATDLVTAALTLPIGEIALEEARFLSELVRNLTHAGPIIEVGTLFGFSTRIMALAKCPERPLLTVDNYAWNPLQLPPSLHQQCTATALAEAVSVYNVQIIVSDKAAFYEQYDGPTPSLVFLDAAHSYEETTKDIQWARRVKADAICLHDYSPAHPGVVRAVDDAGGPKRLVRSLALLADQ